jgi:hypothetical protein
MPLRHGMVSACRSRLTMQRRKPRTPLSAQRPLLVRGLFFEAWQPAFTPVHARQPADLSALFERKSGDGHGLDPERALAAMFDAKSPWRPARVLSWMS